MNKLQAGLILLLGLGLSGSGLFPVMGEESEQTSPRVVSLSEVLCRALQNNFDIRMARLDQKISRYDEMAANSVYDTLLTASADYTHDRFKMYTELLGTVRKDGNWDLSLGKKFPWGTELMLEFSNEYIFTDSPFLTINPSYDSHLQLSLSQPLLKNWGGLLTRGELELVRIGVDSFNLLAWEGIEKSLAGVAHSYWELVRIQEEVRLKEKMEERARYLYRLSQEQLRMGMVERVELLAAEANLRIREAEVILSREKLVTASRFLQLLLDDSDSTLLLPGDELEIPRLPPSDTFPECLQIALENRWDYLRTRDELQAQDISVEMAENSLWPELDLVGSFARNGLSDEWGRSLEDIFSEDHPQYFVGIQLTYFLENRFADSDAEKAELEKGKALIRVKQVEREIYTEVDDQLRTCRVSLELARRENEILRLQQEKLAEEEKRYKYGRSNSKTVIDYQNDLLLAQLSLTEALTVYYKSLIDLQVVQGVFLRNQMETP